MDEESMRADPIFTPDGPAKVETRYSYWLFRPSSLPDEVGGMYLRMPKEESGYRPVAGPHLEDGKWLPYEGATWVEFPQGVWNLRIFYAVGPGRYSCFVTSEVLGVVFARGVPTPAS